MRSAYNSIIGQPARCFCTTVVVNNNHDSIDRFDVKKAPTSLLFDAGCQLLFHSLCSSVQYDITPQRNYLMLRLFHANFMSLNSLSSWYTKKRSLQKCGRRWLISLWSFPSVSLALLEVGLTTDGWRCEEHFDLTSKDLRSSYRFVHVETSITEIGSEPLSPCSTRSI